MDAIDGFSAQWAAQRPGLDVESIETWGRLKRSASLFDKVLSQALEEHELTMPEFEVLAALVRFGPPFEMRPTELTQSLIITPGAVTARLNTLGRRGLIARRSHDGDGRVQLVALTAKGRHLFDPAFDAILVACRQILNHMDQAVLAELQTSLRGLIHAVDATLSDADSTVPNR